MKITGKLKILDSFKLTGKGFAAKCRIIEGIVGVGSLITLKIDSKNITLQINGIDFIDNIITNESWAVLTFVYDNENQLRELENTKLKEQLVDVYDKN